MRKSINKLAGVFSFLFLHAFFLCISLTGEALAEGSVPAVPGAPAAPAAAPAQPSIVEMVMPFLLMFGVMYFLIIRPQQKKVREQQDMLSALAVGNEVVTTSGIFGVVKELGEKVVTLEVADRVNMRFVRSQIAQKISSESKS
ncbi:MAG: preprotein translocase subunit YajC [Bdellovibrionales bacterium]|nr:preprotein translocase subunit YajC [Bdellovibrionales bacterium]